MTKNNKIAQIKRLSDELKSLMEPETLDKVGIMVETSEDEAVMLGSIDAYLYFASEILERVSACGSGNGREVNCEGSLIPFIEMGDSMSHEAHVAIRSLGIVKTKSEYESILKIFGD